VAIEQPVEPFDSHFHVAGEEQEMIEAVLTIHGLQEWLDKQPKRSNVGFTIAITGDEAYPADETVIA
jgi:hypothetical protein